MELTIFQSDHGDCLLLKSKKANILIDGGMGNSYTEFVQDELGKLREQGDVLDLVYISHIDDDHVQGIVKLLDDEVSWRVYEYHSNHTNGDRRRKEPKFKRPPKIKHIWHNAFKDQISANSGRIQDMLATSVQALSFQDNEEFNDLANHYSNIATGVSSAIKISNRISNGQLNIPLNHHFKGKLAMVRDNNNPINFCGLGIYVIGPFWKDLLKLRKAWNDWLGDSKHKSTIRRLRKKAIEDSDKLSKEELSSLYVSAEIGVRQGLSAANLASLMLLIEEDGKSILLTGDGHADDILKGLKHVGKLNGNGGIHVNVLKIPHHGAEKNTTPEFARKVTADHYVFCGNGHSKNPDIRIVELYVNSRIGKNSEKSRNSQTDHPFSVWFNTNQKTIYKYKTNMDTLKNFMKERKTSTHNGRLTYCFFDDAYKTITL